MDAPQDTTWLIVPHYSLQQKNTIFVFPLSLTEICKCRSCPASLRYLIFHLPALPGSSTQSSTCACDTGGLHASG